MKDLDRIFGERIKVLPSCLRLDLWGETPLLKISGFLLLSQISRETHARVRIRLIPSLFAKKKRIYQRSAFLSRAEPIPKISYIEFQHFYFFLSKKQCFQEYEPNLFSCLWRSDGIDTGGVRSRSFFLEGGVTPPILEVSFWVGLSAAVFFWAITGPFSFLPPRATEKVVFLIPPFFRVWQRWRTGLRLGKHAHPISYFFERLRGLISLFSNFSNCRVSSKREGGGRGGIFWRSYFLVVITQKWVGCSTRELPRKRKILKSASQSFLNKNTRLPFVLSFWGGKRGGGFEKQIMQNSWSQKDSFGNQSFISGLSE